MVRATNRPITVHATIPNDASSSERLEVTHPTPSDDLRAVAWNLAHSKNPTVLRLSLIVFQPLLFLLSQIPNELVHIRVEHPRRLVSKDLWWDGSAPLRR